MYVLFLRGQSMPRLDKHPRAHMDLALGVLHSSSLVISLRLTSCTDGQGYFTLQVVLTLFYKAKSPVASRGMTLEADLLALLGQCHTAPPGTC